MSFWGWLSGLFSGGARAQQIAPPVGADPESPTTALRMVHHGTPPRRDARRLLEALPELPWLSSITGRRGDAVASRTWALFRRVDGRDPRTTRGFLSEDREERVEARARAVRDGDLEEIDRSHPLLEMLERPNPAMSGFDFWRLASVYVDVVGEAFWLIERKGRRPVELWPVVPHHVDATPTLDRRSYLMRPSFLGRSISVAAEDVIWLRRRNPADPLNGRGVGVGQSLVDELELDELMATSAKARFHNNQKPDLIIGFTELASEEAATEAAERFRRENQGVQRHGRTHFFPGGFTAQQIGQTMVESQYVEGRKINRDFAMQNFGVPPEIFGVLENANRSTIDAAEVLFYGHSTVPVMDFFRAEMQCFLVPDFGKGLWLDYDDPVPANKEAQQKVMIALPGAFTVNEVRARAGLPPLEGDAGEELMKPAGAPAIPVETTPQDAAPGDGEDDDTEEDEEETEESTDDEGRARVLVM